MTNLANQIVAQFKYIPRSVLMTLLLCFAYLYIKDNRKESFYKVKELFSEKWIMAFLFYSAYMITSTIFVRYRKTPYLNIFSNLYFRPGDAGYNNEIIKNILFFIPFSFLYLQAFKPKHSAKVCILVSLCATAFIEFSQLLFCCGEFQIADLIDNFIGGMLGWLSWDIIQWTRQK